MLAAFTVSRCLFSLLCCTCLSLPSSALYLLASHGTHIVTRSPPLLPSCPPPRACAPRRRPRGAPAHDTRDGARSAHDAASTTGAVVAHRRRGRGPQGNRGVLHGRRHLRPARPVRGEVQRHLEHQQRRQGVVQVSVRDGLAQHQPGVRHSLSLTMLDLHGKMVLTRAVPAQARELRQHVRPGRLHRRAELDSTRAARTR